MRSIHGSRVHRRAAFTLVEVLTAIALFTLIAGLLATVLHTAVQTTNTIQADTSEPGTLLWQLRADMAHLFYAAEPESCRFFLTGTAERVSMTFARITSVPEAASAECIVRRTAYQWQKNEGVWVRLSGRPVPGQGWDRTNELAGGITALKILAHSGTEQKTIWGEDPPACPDAVTFRWTAATTPRQTNELLIRIPVALTATSMIERTVQAP